MAIQDHYLTEDLDQLNEELLKLHNLSVSAIKDAQEGNFDNMLDYQYRITRSIKIMTALHNKKKMRDENMMLNSVYNYRGWVHEWSNSKFSSRVYGL